MNVLIGHTGFVGGTLFRHGSWNRTVASADVESLVGAQADLVVCAGVRAAKWMAKRDPATDWASIEKLWRVLETIQAGAFVLLSTVDVYKDPNGVDERAPTFEHGNHAYGAHRLRLERLTRACFPNALIVRLPALFGDGLRKNVLFDLLSGRAEGVDPCSTFQWYDLARLWGDLERARQSKLDLVNFAVEPLATSNLLDRCFPNAVGGLSQPRSVTYDVQTEHGAAFGQPCSSYIMSAAESLDRMEVYVRRARERGSP